MYIWLLVTIEMAIAVSEAINKVKTKKRVILILFEPKKSLLSVRTVRSVSKFNLDLSSGNTPRYVRKQEKAKIPGSKETASYWYTPLSVWLVAPNT